MTDQDQPDMLRIVVEEITPTFRIFHTNFELTSLEGQQVSRHEVPTEQEFAPIATEVVQLPGVESVCLRPYGIGVNRGVAFDWDDITRSTEEILVWVGKTFGVHQKPIAPKAVPMAKTEI